MARSERRCRVEERKDGTPSFWADGLENRQEQWNAPERIHVTKNSVTTAEKRSIRTDVGVL